MPQELRAVDWTGNSLAFIDQTVLPHRTETVEIRDVDALVDAIQRLVVRGAPAIGAAGAYGVALALLQGEREGWDTGRVRAEVARIREARPTAVNLMVCVDRVMTRFDEGIEAVLAEARPCSARTSRPTARWGRTARTGCSSGWAWTGRCGC